MNLVKAKGSVYKRVQHRDHPTATHNSAGKGDWVRRTRCGGDRFPGF